MGSAFEAIESYTYKEAAHRLGCSQRTIFNYVRQGLIRKTLKEGQPVLLREDVEQVAFDKGTDAPAMNRKSFIQMSHRLQKLENEMTTVKHILEIRDDHLRLKNDTEALALYRAATDALSDGKWSGELIDSWARTLEKVDEAFFEAMAKAINDSKAWVVFLRLCSAMQTFSISVANEEPNLEWQARAKKMDEVRNKIRGAVILYIEMGRGTTPQDLLLSIEDPKRALLKRVAD